jgi:hypothetical protein
LRKSSLSVSLKVVKDDIGDAGCGKGSHSSSIYTEACASPKIEGRKGGAEEMAAKYSDFGEVGPTSPAGRFLRRFWQPICVSEILKAGRAIPLRMFDDDFTLFRGESGRSRARRGALGTGLLIPSN